MLTILVDTQGSNAMLSTLSTDPIRNQLLDETAASCFFTSVPEAPFRKAVLQITERCNLHCVHCFVSAGPHGSDMPLDAIRSRLISRLLECRVSRVIVTGGEPFAHPDIIEIVRALSQASIQVVICTNGTLITSDMISSLSHIDGVAVNVSLDGFSHESHDRFRGATTTTGFTTTIQTIEMLGSAGLLQGILVTPHVLMTPSELPELLAYAESNGATYILLNRLSLFGRGEKSETRFGASDLLMRQIDAALHSSASRLRIALVRFPNDEKPLARCPAGRSIIGIDVHGEVSACPYLVFAARTANSKHSPAEFLLGNILSDSDIAERLDSYDIHQQYNLGNNSTCTSCAITEHCGKGCPAAVISGGKRIEERDHEVCPLH